MMYFPGFWNLVAFLRRNTAMGVVDKQILVMATASAICVQRPRLSRVANAARFHKVLKTRPKREVYRDYYAILVPSVWAIAISMMNH
jgi:hypothetical protein